MYFIQEAYKTFTIDKVIGAIIKQVYLLLDRCHINILTMFQVQNILADAKSQDLLEVLKKERALLSPATQDQINSRRSAEKVLGPDENLFRIDWASGSDVISNRSPPDRKCSYRRREL